MTSYKKDCESVKYMIPLYVRGILSDSEEKEFQIALSECPDLKDEIERWKKINNAYQTIERTLPQPSDRVYSRITERITEKSRFSFLQRFIPSQRVSLAFVAAQLLIIIALGGYVMNLKNEYKTLSAPSMTEGRLLRINVVFKEKATEAEIRNLLLQMNARIIDGPCSSGLYILRIPSQERLDDVLNTLRKNNIVVMAERAY